MYVEIVVHVKDKSGEVSTTSEYQVRRDRNPVKDDKTHNCLVSWVCRGCNYSHKWGESTFFF